MTKPKALMWKKLLSLKWPTIVQVLYSSVISSTDYFAAVLSTWRSGLHWYTV